jgi:hypothetical protein
MTEEQPTDRVPPPVPEQNPADLTGEWATGDEPMTAPQASYLQALCREVDEEFEPGLSAADAAKRIEELRARTVRGGETPKPADREQ